MVIIPNTLESICEYEFCFQLKLILENGKKEDKKSQIVIQSEVDGIILLGLRKKMIG